ncbi:hypothetical protein EVAR_69557_1 [Eumeta japonica]|uniref:Uncharacterized protein n=1 Tax=Eumeta variegata TaxID=151549 RepID=A0A4C2A364_EUMVA|nr:hypothetical protein EVAR_69557_1 [Eumeta japonica]
MAIWRRLGAGAHPKADARRINRCILYPRIIFNFGSATLSAGPAALGAVILSSRPSLSVSRAAACVGPVLVSFCGLKVPKQRLLASARAASARAPQRCTNQASLRKAFLFT